MMELGFVEGAEFQITVENKSMSEEELFFAMEEAKMD